MEVIIVALATIVAIGASLYLFALSRVSWLKKNWVQYRCNPIYMPMAGMVGQDIVQNFTKCTMKGFQDYAGFIMDPLMSEFSVVNDTLGEVGDTMNSMRSMMSGVRGGFLGIIGSVFGKIQNLMSQFQYLIIRMRTVMGRIVGVMMSFIMIFYTGMLTGESINNGPIMGTVRFLCFDPETQIQTAFPNKTIAIKDVELGMHLKNGSIVTSFYKLSGKGVKMFFINGVKVSGNHKIKYKNKFISVKNHPFAIPTSECEYLACINTTTNRIYTHLNEFLDFSELNDFHFQKFKRQYVGALYNSNDTSDSNYKHFYTGVSMNTRIPLKNNIIKKIENIDVGDILDNNDKVIGIVRHVCNDNVYTSLSSTSFVTPDTWVLSENKSMKASNMGYNTYFAESQYYTVCQLITTSSTYPILLDTGRRMMILDDLETTDKYFYAVKDAIISSGRFRGKVIVV